MSFPFPSTDELKAWSHDIFDRIYLLTNDDWLHHAEMPEELKDDYKLFVVGAKPG